MASFSVWTFNSFSDSLPYVTEQLCNHVPVSFQKYCAWICYVNLATNDHCGRHCQFSRYTIQCIPQNNKIIIFNMKCIMTIILWNSLVADEHSRVRAPTTFQFLSQFLILFSGSMSPGLNSTLAGFSKSSTFRSMSSAILMLKSLASRAMSIGSALSITSVEYLLK